MTGKKYNCIVVLGPTASGKTHLACKIAFELNGEIISADSRQVYRHLDIGTGKDLGEYSVEGTHVPYHLIDICEPEKQFYLHDFIRECRNAFLQIESRHKTPVISGGTGLYLDSLHKDFSFTQVPENETFREEAELKTKEELLQILNSFPLQFHKHADTDSKKRIIRAIEIARYLSEHRNEISFTPSIYHPFYIGIHVTKEERVSLIRKRLQERINSGLIEEAEMLLKRGLSHERLQYFGLEYKFLSLYLQGEITLDEMQEKLAIAIIQFSKRQMTWFRKMEREGIPIHWITRDDDPSFIIRELKEIFGTTP